MSEARATTTRIAAATLLAASCGQEASGEARGTDVSDARLAHVVASICAQEIRCREVEQDEEDDAPPTEQECIGEGLDYFEVLRSDDPKCADARLDYEACVAELSCDASLEEDDAPCVDLYDAVERGCAYGLDEPG